MSSKRRFDVSNDKATAFVDALARREAEYKPADRRKPTLKDFLSMPAVYEAIKGMLDRDLQWSEIAGVVNETQGTHLKPSTISSAFCYVAEHIHHEPRKEAIAQKIAQRRTEKEARLRAENQPQQCPPVVAAAT